MQSVSQLWTDILSDSKHKTDYKIVINGVEYGQDSLIELESECDIFSGSAPVVGQCISARMKASLYLPINSIPRQSECKLYTRLTLGSLASEWIEQGTFFIDKRLHDRAGKLTLQTFDAMRKGDKRMYISDGEQEEWPKTDIDVVEIIAEDFLGVNIHPSVYDIVTNAYEVQYPGYGDGGYTAREVLGFIGAMYAGNWIIDDNNYLKLLTLDRFAQRKSGTGVEFDLNPQTGILHVVYPENYDGPTFSLDATNGHIFVSYPEDYDGPEFVLLDDGTIVAVAYSPDFEISDDLAENFESLIPFQKISRVTINVGTDETTGDPIYYTSGDDTEAEFTIECPWGTQAMCDAILTQLSSWIYLPYNLTNVVFDPCFELWDCIHVQEDDLFTGITAYRRYFHPELYSADISATGEDEIDSEYPYESAQQREIKRTTATTRARLIVNSNMIAAEVIRATNAESGLSDDIDDAKVELNENMSDMAAVINQTIVEERTALEIQAGQIEASVTQVMQDLEGYQTEVSRYMRFSADGLELGMEGTPQRQVMDNTGTTWYGPDGQAKAEIKPDPNDQNVYKFVISNGQVQQLDFGEHWAIIASSAYSGEHLTIKWRTT